MFNTISYLNYINYLTTSENIQFSCSSATIAMSGENKENKILKRMLPPDV